jgi:hypothetical protein
MAFGTQVVMVAGAHRHDGDRGVAQRRHRHLVEEVLERAGERAAVDRGGENHRVRALDRAHHFGGVVLEGIERAAVGKRDPLLRQVDELRPRVAPRGAALQRVLDGAAQPAGGRDAPEDCGDVDRLGHLS